MGAVRAAIYRQAPGGTEVEVKTVVKEAPKPKNPALDLNLDQVNSRTPMFTALPCPS